MKSKNKTYLLLTVVLAVWGVIGYKMWLGAHPNTPQIQSQDIGMAFTPKNEVSMDTFSIQTINRDPFLGTFAKPKKKKTTSKIKKKPPIEWPAISFQGIITNQNVKQQLYVVTINGQQQLLTKGQRLDELTLVKGTKKQIIVRYKNERKTIKVQE